MKPQICFNSTLLLTIPIIEISVLAICSSADLHCWQDGSDEEQTTKTNRPTLPKIMLVTKNSAQAELICMVIMAVPLMQWYLLNSWHETNIFFSRGISDYHFVAQPSFFKANQVRLTEECCDQKPPDGWSCNQCWHAKCQSFWSI